MLAFSVWWVALVFSYVYGPRIIHRMNDGCCSSSRFDLFIFWTIIPPIYVGAGYLTYRWLKKAPQ